MARTVELRSDRPMKDGPAARSCRLGSEAIALRPIGQIHGGWQVQLVVRERVQLLNLQPCQIRKGEGRHIRSVVGIAAPGCSRKSATTHGEWYEDYASTSACSAVP